MLAEIAEAAFKEFATIAGIPSLVYPNVDATPTDEHVRLFILPSESQSDTLGCEVTSGVIQASIYTHDGSGVINAQEYADLIIAALPRLHTFTEGATTVLITKTGWTAPGISGDGWLQTPVSIHYEAH